MALPVIATPAVWPAQQIIAVARPVLAPQAERQAGSVRRALLLIGFITASLAVELVLAFAITALGAALAKAEAALERATGSILDANHIFVEAAKQGAM